MTILQDIKTGLGVMPNNLGFDMELLMHVNASSATLVQLGLDEFDDLTITEETEWPTFTNATIGGLVPSIMLLLVRPAFDPIASETIGKSIEARKIELTGRLAHELAEVVDAN